MAYESHSDVQSLLADVRAWVPIMVEVDGTQHQITGLRIEHDDQGAQTNAVLETTEDNPTTPTHLIGGTDNASAGVAQ